MDKLQAIFLSEASELLSDLERILLEYEKDIHNETCIQEIFRVMHTLKGSASMFGFDDISSLTHELESIYDLIRDGKAEPSGEILQLTFQAVDQLNLLRSNSSQIDRAAYDNLLQAVRNASLKERKITAHNQELHTYYIWFKPPTNCFSTGTNPLFLIDDLCSLGNSIALPRFEQPASLDDFQPRDCYVSFEVVLATVKSTAEIREVFMFVEDQGELQIALLSTSDLTSDERFRESILHDYSLDNPPFGYDILKALSTTHANSSAPTFERTSATRNNNDTIRVSSEKLDELMNLVSELVTSQARLSLISDEISNTELSNVAENMEKITRRLRDNAFNICLVPIESLVIRFQRLIRDLSRGLNKEIDFLTQGIDTEIDRSLIEKLTDPILHILRNSIDHGIESPAERAEQGKSPHGTIRFHAYHLGTSVHIEISDDGKGLNSEKIREKAISKGIISAEDELTEQEIYNLVFAAGFSTAEKVTDVSGRGVGMDIVRRNIEGMYGEVSVSSRPGLGTTILIKLPLTLSIMDGLLVQIGRSKYLLPLTSIEKCFEIQTRKVKEEITQKHVFDGELLPVFNLHRYFHEKHCSDEITQIIKINYIDFPVAITVDAVIGEYQAVMKPLGQMYADQEEFSGATILGDGTVALVMDTTKLIKHLTNLSISQN